MARGAESTLDVRRLVGRWSLQAAGHAGRFTYLVIDMVRGLTEWRIYIPRTLEQAMTIGYGSLFIVLLVAGFTGAVTSLQAGYQFTGSVPLYIYGAVIGESVILELGPVLTGLILAGRIGARYAAELGTMRVTEQIDALESLGRSPVSHLILPRVLAGMMVIPALTMFANVTGFVSGWLAAKSAIGITNADFIFGARYYFPSVRPVVLDDQGDVLRGGRNDDPLLYRLQHPAGGGRSGARHHAGGRRCLGDDPAARYPARQTAAQPLMIELRKVSKRFVDHVVLDQVDLTVEDGKTVALLGPSGVGKSVLLKHIIGLIKPDSGEVLVDDLHVAGLKRQELAELRTRIGYVFQNGALFDSMDVNENIQLGITDEKSSTDAAYCTRPGDRVLCGWSTCRPRWDSSIPRSCRVGCANVWGSRGQSPASRSTCCMTSRLPGSIR